MDDLKRAVTKALFLNEVSGNSNAAYRFSDAGGKSGYSFGCTQLDVTNNPAACTCLIECGFTMKEIRRLKLMDKDISDLNAKLKQHKKTVDTYDAKQVQQTIEHVQRVSSKAGIRYADLEGIVAACDYHNQFYMSDGGKFTKYFQGNQAVTADNILDFKLYHTKWGKTEKDDINRRAANINEVCKGVA